YDNSTHQLTSVDAPMADTVRQTRINQTAAGLLWRVDSIRDPDGKSAQFATGNLGTIEARTTRRGFTTRFHYDEGGLLDMSRIEMASPQPDIVHTFCAGESASLTSCSGGDIVLSAKVRTTYDGPRLPSDTKDTTAFYLNRFGA